MGGLEKERKGVGRREGLKEDEKEEWSQKKMELEEGEGVGKGGSDQNGAWKKRMDVGRRGRSGKRKKELEGDGIRTIWVLICSSSASGSLCKCDAIEAVSVWD